MPFDGGCTRGDKGRVSDGDLQDELGRQGQMIRELVAEVGRLKEEQGSMTMQVRGTPSPNLHAHPSLELKTDHWTLRGFSVGRWVCLVKRKVKSSIPPRSNFLT
jgi:hypothetical protein